MSPETIAILAFAIVILTIGRQLVLRRWYRHRLTARTAAILYTLPILAMLGYVAVTVDSWLVRAGVVVSAFLTYAFAEFFLRGIGGEFDPPAAEGDVRGPRS